jgi:hypothetical protein
VGPHAKGKKHTANGEALEEFADTHSFILANTYFRKRAGKQATWSKTVVTNKETQKRCEVYNQIDFVLCRASNMRRLRNAHTRPATRMQSDHRLVVAEFAATAKAWASTKTTALETLEGMVDSYERDSFANEAVRTAWRTAVKTVIQALDARPTWERLKEVLAEQAAKLLPKKQRKKWQPNRFRDNITIERLSKKQQRIREKTASAKTKHRAEEYKAKRRQVLKELKAECGRQAIR